MAMGSIERDTAEGRPAGRLLRLGRIALVIGAAAAALVVATPQVSAAGLSLLRVFVTNDPANPVPVAGSVSVVNGGPAPGDLVTLRTIDQECGLGLGLDSRVLPDGTGEPGFEVPAGKVLVITAAVVTVQGDFDEVGHIADVLLTVGELDTRTLSRQTVMIDTGVDNLPSIPAATATFSFPTGITFGAGTRPCAQVHDLFFQTTLHVRHASAHGYLADA